MSRVIHFEIPAEDPKRAMKFYEAAFGWKYMSYDGPMSYWMIQTGDDEQPGINGGLMPRQHPGQNPVSVIGVASVDDAARAITKAGGEETAPKMAIPGVGYAAYFKDTEGNIFGVFEPDESAG